MGKTRKKKQRENHTSKVTKLPKTKRQKYGMNETNKHKKSRLFIYQIAVTKMCTKKQEFPSSLVTKRIFYLPYFLENRLLHELNW